jgi:hypothetical protein
MIEPLHLSYEIACSPEHAFTTWTTRMSSWWPKGHSASGNPDTLVVLEPHRGGRIFERTPDGTEIDWGEITAWSPPRHFGYLWHIGRDRGEATDVSVTFVDLGNGITQLDIVQTGWERLGTEGVTWREANTRGWDALLAAFVPAATGTGP